MSQSHLDHGAMPQPVTFGKYFLLHRVNSGGMAEVFMAKTFGVEGFERLVAVKRILSHIAADAQFIRMFVDEAKLAGQLHHANIAQIFDLGRVGDDYYIALEYVSGRDLKQVWERIGELDVHIPIPLACFIVSQVCAGLEYAHNKRDPAGNPLEIVHRDVSPQNVLISYEGEVKLIDFGVAKAASSGSDTRVGLLKGKLSYMSPEQVRAMPLDGRSDTFAAGIVLYELLTGERLFLGDTDFDTLEKVRKVEVAPPGLFNPDIPPALEEIVLKALQKHPNHRYQSAAEMQLELQRYMFSLGTPCTARDLAAFMENIFISEVTRERQLLEHFQSLSISELTRTGEEFAWDDSDIETQVFARDTGESITVDSKLTADTWGSESASVWGANQPVSDQTALLEDPAAFASPTLDLDELGATDLPDDAAMDDAAMDDAAAASAMQDDVADDVGDDAAAPNSRREREKRRKDKKKGAKGSAVPAPATAPVAARPAPPAPASAPVPVRAASPPPATRPQAPAPAPPAVKNPTAPPARPPATPAAASRPASAPPATAAPASSSGTTWILVAAVVVVLALVVGLFFVNRQPTPPSVATGTLVVRTTPDVDSATIRLDGAQIHQGEVPHPLADLPPGSHEILVEASGFEPATSTITVVAGTNPPVNLRLQPSLRTSLTITSSPPGATITRGTDVVGTTPTELSGLVPGTRLQLMASLDGYEPQSLSFEFDGRRESAEFTLVIASDAGDGSADAGAQADAGLAAAPAEPATEPSAPEGPPVFTVESVPRGADWSLTRDGRQIATGTTPGQTPALEEGGTYVVTITRAGFVEQTTSIDPAARNRTVSVTLQPTREPQPPARDTATAAAATPRPVAERAPAPERTPVANPTPEPAPTPTPGPAPTPEPAPAAEEATGTGTLNVQSRPAARVMMDGTEIGYTPIVGYTVPAGRHRIVLINEEFDMERSYLVNIEAGQTRTVRNVVEP